MDLAPQTQETPAQDFWDVVLVPVGGLRIVVHVKGRRAKDTTMVGVTLMRDGGHGASFTFYPDLRESPFFASSMADLGRDASVKLQPGWELGEEASFLAQGLDPGSYVLFARLSSRGPPPDVLATARVGVAADRRSTVRLDLDPGRPEARLNVRVVRAGKAVAADVNLHLGDLTIGQVRLDREEGATTTVPADTDVDVAVTQFPGHREFGLPPPQRVRVAPGDLTTVTVELPAGISVTIRAASPDVRETGVANLALWRHGHRSFAQVVNGAMAPIPGDASAWTGRLPAGRYTATMTTVAGRGVGTFDLLAPGPQDVRIDLRPNRGGHLRIRWQEADGRPAVKLAASLIREGTDNLEDVWAYSLIGDGEGVTEWLLPEGGSYGVYLWSRKLYRRFVVAGGAPVNVELRMPSTAGSNGDSTLSGTIKTPDGAGAVGVAFLIDMADSPWTTLGQTEGGGKFKVSGLSGGDGRFRVPFSWYRIQVPYQSFDEAIRLFPGPENHLEVQLRTR